MYRQTPEFPFQGQPIEPVLRDHMDKLRREIGRLAKTELMQSDNATLEQRFSSRYAMDVPVLADKNEMDAEQGEIELKDVDAWNGIIVHGRGPKYKSYIVHLPFTGDYKFFELRPNPFDIQGYEAIEIKISDRELKMTYLLDARTGQLLDSDLTKLNKHLARMRDNVKPYQEQLLPAIKLAIEQRRKELGADDELVNSIGIKIRERSDAPKTYVMPDIRPRIVPVSTSGSSMNGGQADPTLDLKIYDRIIEICKGMAHVMERSPSAFVGMKEEYLRWHFIVQLNGQFEGAATGETFNASGKTDALIRVKDQNLFVGEFKFWDGEASLGEAIDQILKYTTWRDTKTAIILFNRNKDFSAVVTKATEIMRAHANFKRMLSTKDEGTETRWVFRHKNDAERELLVTLLLFDVPTE